MRGSSSVLGELDVHDGSDDLNDVSFIHKL